MNSGSCSNGGRPLLRRHPRAVGIAGALTAGSLLALFPTGDALAQEAVEPTPQAAPRIEPATPGDPDWFDRLLARTTEPLPEVEVGPEDGFFRATIPAKLLKPVQAFDGYYLLTFDYGPGPQSFAECYVYADALDLAGTLVLVSETVFELVAENFGPIEAKAVHGIDAGAIGATPYMGLAWLYRARGDGGKGDAVAGQAKHWMAMKQGRGLYCQSTALGYDAALFNVFRTLVATLEYAEPLGDGVHYAEIARARIGDKVIGVAHNQHRIDEDGDIEVREALSILVPIDAQTVVSSDAIRLDYSNLAGEMVARVEVKAEHGEVVTHLNLARDEANEWIVSGVFKGKDLEANLGAVALRSHFGERLDLRRFLETAEVDRSIAFSTWTADLDPTRLIDSTWTYRGREKSGVRWRVEAGSMAFDVVSTEGMELRTMVMPMGGADMTIEQVYAEGDVFAPLAVEPAPADEPPAPGE